LVTVISKYCSKWWKDFIFNLPDNDSVNYLFQIFPFCYIVETKIYNSIIQLFIKGSGYLPFLLTSQKILPKVKIGAVAGFAVAGCGWRG
jgi:hypothetical protein